MPTNRLKGVFALLLTPFKDNGDVDWNSYDSYVDWQLSQNPHGVFAVCGSSEMANLTLNERLLLAERAVRRAGNVPVLATANMEASLMDQEQELLRMGQTGVTGVVLIPPNGMGHDQNQLGEYFARMANLSSVPVLLYECPLVKPHLINAEIYSELALKHGIVGIKDTTCTLEGITSKIQGAPDSIVYQANTPLMLQSIHKGAAGIMAITATASLSMVLELWQLGNRNDPSADRILDKLIALDKLLGQGFTATAKYLVSLQGISMGLRTRTGSKLDAATAQALDNWLKSS